MNVPNEDKVVRIMTVIPEDVPDNEVEWLITVKPGTVRGNEVEWLVTVKAECATE
jgi:hypothetical protein